MINVVASVTVKAGMRDEFIVIFKGIMPEVHAEEGCIEYFPTIDVDLGSPAQDMNENMVTIIEKWESLDHLKAHSVAPHMQAYRERVKDIVLGMSLKVVEAV